MLLERTPPVDWGIDVPPNTWMDGETVKTLFCVERPQTRNMDLSHYSLPAFPSRQNRKDGQHVKLVIPGQFPGLNDLISAERTSRYKGAEIKRNAQKVVEFCARKQLRGFRPAGPVWMKYTWYERNRKRDKDNISSFGRKVIQDGLVKAGVLKNDGWKGIEGFSDRFCVDEKHPRVEIEIMEARIWENMSLREKQRPSEM